MRILETQKVN